MKNKWFGIGLVTVVLLLAVGTSSAFAQTISPWTTGIDLQKPDEMLVLLALAFEPRAVDDPAGTVTLTFAGKAALQIDVECLEAELKDLGPGWAARARPVHPLDDGPDQSSAG